MADGILISWICGISKLVRREPIPKKKLSKLEENKKLIIMQLLLIIYAPAPHKGVLGMNFISGLGYRTDFEKGVIIWK